MNDAFVSRNLLSPSVFVLVIVALGVFVWRLLRQRQEDKLDEVFAIEHGCQPVESKLPYKWPFALDVLKKQWDVLPSQKLLAFQSQYFEKIGPTMELKLFGQVGYMTIDPKNVEALNSSRFNDFCLGSRREGLLPLLGEGIFVQDGSPWKHSRELLRRQFVRVQYHDLSVFEEHVEHLISDLSLAKGVVDLQPSFFKFTLATTTALLFGEAVGSLGEEVQTKFAECFDYATYVSAIRLRLADFCWAYTPSRFTKSCDMVKQYADHFVQKALRIQKLDGHETAVASYPFILDLYDEMQDPVMVRDQLVNVLLAGRDTTACLLSWTFFLLVRHPSVLHKLREEVRAVTQGTPKINRGHLLRMPYLKAVLDETSRLYPQIPVNVRIAARTTLLPQGGGPDGSAPVLVKRGLGVATSIYHMHRLKDVYGSDAEEFRPERWLDDDLKGIGWGFMPFHGGPRICLGRSPLSIVDNALYLAGPAVSITDSFRLAEDFALTEASYVIIRVVQTFPDLRLPPEIIPVPTGQEKQVLGVVVSIAEGCKVLLR